MVNNNREAQAGPRLNGSTRTALATMVVVAGALLGVAVELAESWTDVQVKAEPVLPRLNKANGRATHEFDCDLLAVQQILALKDDSERALANLLSDAVVDANDVGG